MTSNSRRFGQRTGLISCIVPNIAYGVVGLLIFFAMWPYVYFTKNEVLITLGLFAIWRYGWQALHNIRAFIYGLFRFPCLRRNAMALPEAQAFPRHIYFIVPSYKEEPWVTVESFQSIFVNLAEIPCEATIVVATASEREDQIIGSLYRNHPVRDKVNLVLQRQSEGKRVAMGHMLRAVARRYEDEYNSICVFMDGDTYIEPQTLRKTIPFFAAYKDLGALTTNQVAFINTQSRWYQHWFNLKFGQRHLMFQSHSLSNRVLTLTGRFSVFRTAVVVEEAFIQRIENDTLTHWLHGKFRFLMGDDKSSWYETLKQGWRMLYIPDVVVYSLESRDASFMELSTSLPYRWYGNTLRNNARALALGPSHVGGFIWVAILDQRISMWTGLVGISGALLLSIVHSYVYLPFYLSWVIMVRVVQQTLIAFRGHPVSMLTIPLMLYNQWVGSFIKIRAYYNLSDQKWSKGGSEQKTSDAYKVEHPWVNIMPDFLMGFAYLVFVFALLMGHGVLELPRWRAIQPVNRSQAPAVPQPSSSFSGGAKVMNHQK